MISDNEYRMNWGLQTRRAKASCVAQSTVSAWSHMEYADSEEKGAVRHFPVHCAVDFPGLVYIVVLSEPTIIGPHDPTSVSTSHNNLTIYKPMYTEYVEIVTYLI
jgi:hypothetical protein